MNEILLPPTHHRWPSREFFRRMLWNAARTCALSGLYTWRLDESWLRIDRRKMAIAGLGTSFCGAKIAHISDLHCSPIVLEKYLRRCVEVVNSLHADFVVITGDFVTGHKFYARRVARALRHLHPSVAAMACLGNHDYGIFHPNGLGTMKGLADYLTERLENAGVRVLRNEAQIFRRDGDILQFVGMEDYWTSLYDPQKAFKQVQPDQPVVCLVHNPDAAPPAARHGADWVLSGHTHGSSVETRFYDIMPSENKHFFAGQYSLGGTSHLYVNRGLGYARRWNLNSRPEITVFTLCKA